MLCLLAYTVVYVICDVQVCILCHLWSCVLRDVYKCLFFFQAEDGIRDLVRSRGLGDVYKRQPPAFTMGLGISQENARVFLAAGDRRFRRSDQSVPVSYTHLTLPTSDLV